MDWLTQLRQAIDRGVTPPVTDAELKMLGELGCYVETQDVSDAASECIGALQVIRQPYAYGGPLYGRKAKQVRKPITAEEQGLREKVLAFLQAQAATFAIAEVQAFRRDELGGTLLKPMEVDDWIRAKNKLPPPELRSLFDFVPIRVADAWVPRSERWRLELAAIDKYEEVPEAENFAEMIAENEDQLYFSDDSMLMSLNVIVDATRIFEHIVVPRISYLVPDSDTGDYVLVSTNVSTRVIEQLRLAGAQLTTWYGWDEAEAVTFVLTGDLPWVKAIDAEIRVDKAIPTHSRIVLTIDPTLTPAKVEVYYRQVRKQVMRRYRSLGRRSLELVRFVASRPDGETAFQRMTAWNKLQTKRHPKWRYTQESNFSRDYRFARQRLLHPPIQNPEQPK